MRFCPRIRSLHRQRIYPDRDHGVLVPVLQRFRLIAEQWNRIGQLPANGFLVVLRNAPAVGVHEAEAELRGGAAQPLMLHLSAADSIAADHIRRRQPRTPGRSAVCVPRSGPDLAAGRASWRVSLTTGRSRSTTTGGGSRRTRPSSPTRRNRTASPSCTAGWTPAGRTIRLADLLIEVENDLGFSVHFQQPGEKRVDPGEVCALLAAILAHGCNLGLYTMEKVAPDIAYRRLKYVSDWRLVEENQRAALAAIVHGISRLDAAGHWGDGTTSASDGQRFAMPHKVLQRTYSTRFNDFALEFYSFVADN